jgi:hypothetical protein
MRKIFRAEWTGGREPVFLIGTHSRFTASLKRPLRVNDRGAMKLGMIRLIRKTSSAAAGMRPAFRSKGNWPLYRHVRAWRPRHSTVC